MRIYTPEATRRLLKPTPDGCGYMLEYSGQITGLVPAAPSWGPLDVQDILRAVTELNERIPLGWLNGYPVFMSELQYMFYEPPGTWSDTGAVAKTYPQYIILSAQATCDEPRAAMTITHELGHVFMLRVLGASFDGKETAKLAEYRQLRKLGPQINYGWRWDRQIYEVLAEDFRYLFGSPMARLERYRTMDEPPVEPGPPGEDVRQWFLAQLPTQLPEFQVQIITGEEEKPMPEPKLTFSDVAATHWAKADIEAVAAAGLMSGFPDGRFGPEEAVTRAQLAAVIARLFRILNG